jgi:hypothetical protein
MLLETPGEPISFPRAEEEEGDDDHADGEGRDGDHVPNRHHQP